MFRISLRNIQHISSLDFSVDLTHHGLLAIVGKNGVGKTTLARAIRNLSLADTFTTTAGDGIFRPDSEIIYEIEGISRTFIFDPKIGSLNCRQNLPSTWRTDFAVELSIPAGDRFNFFKSLSESDLEIRRALALEDFAIPTELIELLHEIYPGSNFENLVEVRIRKNSYYCARQVNGRYIREDYLSSGEYFLINLYKRIRLRKQLIFVDEIDISLDASAQVRLLDELRKLCDTYQSNVVFTTHSLAMIRMLRPGELSYFSKTNGNATIEPSSFGYVNSLLYGFRGWDRYILTEDDVLKELLEYILTRYCPDAFLTCLVIYVGGSGNVTNMLDQNEREQFLAPPEHVIAVLDGDQRDYRRARRERTYCIPIESVEKALFCEYSNPDFPHRLADESVMMNYNPTDRPKRLFKELEKQRLMSRSRIYEFLCNKYDADMQIFSQTLANFLDSARI
jgi:ABC-type dipeptide/oligopeptide/nickel transport system ATPase subunit